MTGGQGGPTTPLGATASTSPYGCFEHPFNLPFLAESSGCGLRGPLDGVPRSPHRPLDGGSHQQEGLFPSSKFLAPCPTLYQRRNKMGDGLDTMKFYKQHSIIKEWRAHRVRLTSTLKGNHRRQVCGYRAPNPCRQSMEQQLRQTLRDQYAGMGGRLMETTEIRIAGFGGQGVVAGRNGLIGNACHASRWQVCDPHQSFGPEARGSTCSVQLIVSPEADSLSLPDQSPIFSSSCRRTPMNAMEPT